VSDSAEKRVPVKAKAVLVDPVSMTVLWMNESALEDLSDSGIDADGVVGLHVTQAVPMAGLLGLEEALRAAVDTGMPQHVRTGLVSTSKGGVAIVTSVYGLPDGRLLVLTENAWQNTRRDKGATASRVAGRPPT